MMGSAKQDVATQEHCYFCFEVLSCQLRGLAQPAPSFPEALCALFVTWNIREPGSSSKHHRLRGCIGTLEPRPIHTALRDYALTSALRDSRFSPVQLSELPRLSCKVSLLSCFEPGSAWDDWTVGVHGIIINFMDPDMRCKRSATFLPDVPPEQGWDRTETIDALIRKAGFNGRIDGALRASMSLQRYQSTTASLTYEGFVAAQKAAEALAEQEADGALAAQAQAEATLVRA